MITNIDVWTILMKQSLKDKNRRDFFNIGELMNKVIKENGGSLLDLERIWINTWGPGGAGSQNGHGPKLDEESWLNR